VQAQALGVPRGPLYAELVRGQTIVLPSGRTVVPADVLGASVEGPLALVVDVPSPAYLPALLAHPALRRCLQAQGAQSAGHTSAGRLSAPPGGSRCCRPLLCLCTAFAKVT